MAKNIYQMEYENHIKNMPIEKERQKSIEALNEMKEYGLETDAEMIADVGGNVAGTVLPLGGVDAIKAYLGAYDWKVLIFERGGVQFKADINGHNYTFDLVLSSLDLFDIIVYEGGISDSHVVTSSRNIYVEDFIQRFKEVVIGLQVGNR